MTVSLATELCVRFDVTLTWQDQRVTCCTCENECGSSVVSYDRASL